ncbi:hypothetical protein CU097_013896, partial [Rhizopus azygosporus]
TQWCLKRSTAAIWTSNIFKTAIYKNFERQLLEAIDAYNGPYHVSQRTQMVLPGMCAAVSSGLEIVESTSQPPEPRSPQPTITARWKRAFEEGLQLLEDEYITKKARSNELDSRIKEIMEERQSILVKN